MDAEQLKYFIPDIKHLILINMFITKKSFMSGYGTRDVISCLLSLHQEICQYILVIIQKNSLFERANFMNYLSDLKNSINI